MSSRKRPFAEVSGPSQNTPSRAYAPSTPHAIRALQQRSGAKQRSTRSRKPLLDISNIPRPDSARGILRRLAQLTAPFTKRRIDTPPVAGQENRNDDHEDEEDTEEPLLKRPNLTLDVAEGEEGEEDSELPAAPTPSALLDDEGNPTVTFKSIDFSRYDGKQPASEKIDRRVSRVSFSEDVAGEGDDNENEDEDITAEIGRRAVSEDPLTERLPRFSFGSIRMSDFGDELEIRRESDQSRRKSIVRLADLGQDPSSDYSTEAEIDAETENLRRLRRSPSHISDNDTFTHIPVVQDDVDTFRLDVPEDDNAGFSAAERTSRAIFPLSKIDGDDGFDTASEDANDTEPEVADSPLFVPLSPPKTRKQTSLETAADITMARTTQRRRKRLKMTRHGNTIPSMPSSLIKRIAIDSQTRLGKRKPKLGREHMKALEQATEWFFEQVGEDLETYSSHAGRKKRIDESDVLILMRRQRVGKEEGELRRLAKEFLSKDTQAELDLPERL